LKINFIELLNTKIYYWGLGIGDWGLGIGDWAQSPIPNPQSPIPNPQSPILIILEIKIFKINLNNFKYYLIIILFLFLYKN